MQLIVTGRHMDITDPIRAHAEQKSARIMRHFDRIRQIEVIAEAQGAIEKHVEIIVHVDKHDPFIAHAQQEDLYACIDEAVAKIERQVHDHKEKMRNRKHPAASS